MPLPRGRRPPKRPADNELYDRGCDLVEAAAAIRRLCDDRDAARAVPAVLGCVESALHELGSAVSSLDEAFTEGGVPPEVVRRLHRGYMNLGLALADAETAASAARGLAGRAALAAREVHA